LINSTDAASGASVAGWLDRSREHPNRELKTGVDPGPALCGRRCGSRLIASGPGFDRGCTGCRNFVVYSRALADRPDPDWVIGWEESAIDSHCPVLLWATREWSSPSPKRPAAIDVGCYYRWSRRGRLQSSRDTR